MNQNALEQSLANINFDPEAIELAGASTSAGCAVTNPRLGGADDPEAPAAIRAGVDSVDREFVYLAIDPAGQAAVARGPSELHLTHSVWVDLRPAKALELGRRLQICAEVAAQFATAFPEEPDGADAADDLAVGP